MKNLNRQHKKDYYYGYNLRLADELGEFEQHLKQPTSLEGLKKLSRELEKRLMEGPFGRGWDRERVQTDILNEPVEPILSSNLKRLG